MKNPLFIVLLVALIFIGCGEEDKVTEAVNNINLELKVLDYDYLLIDRFIERLKIKFDDMLLDNIV